MPKQCLSVNGETTLIRATVDRVLPIVPAERVLVVTSAEMAGAPARGARHVAAREPAR
ncbi:MAG: hypothetical protein IPN01_04455 [Deltaproteobacteria bacterium]|nr:hypothetical protein [Deltaproteobacteria bacterium]